MKTPIFPDSNVIIYIENFAQKFSFDIVDMKFIKKSKSEGFSADTNDKWQWTFRRKDSPIQISIGVLYPSYISTIMFVHVDRTAAKQSPSNFLFAEYLSKYLKLDQPEKEFEKYRAENSRQQNWNAELKYLEQHLLEGKVNEIIEGKFWPEIYFDWLDYVSPETADKIYEDQIKILEGGNSGKKQTAWVYFLDYFRNKKR